jgi:hypothetical protein
MNKQFGTLPLWAAVLIIGTVVAASVTIVNLVHKPKAA